MNSRYKTGAMILFLLVCIGVLFLNYNGYEKFEVVERNGTQVEQVYESCGCAGSLIVMQSYPPQYSCSGINFCRDVNYTRQSQFG